MSDAPRLDLVLPADRARQVPPDDAESELTELYRVRSAAGGRHVRANMISTLDGAATGADGRSGSINGPADLRVFTVLRALADVVLVGAGTVRAEGYRAPRTPPRLIAGRRARGQADHPALAVVTRSAELPEELTAAAPAPWVFTLGDAPGLLDLRRRLPPDHLHAHDDGVDLASVLATLAGQGLRLVLAEGGPALLGTLLADGLVDELCLTTSPLVVGGAALRVVQGMPWLTPPHTASLAHLLHADGMLMGRWLLDAGRSATG